MVHLSSVKLLPERHQIDKMDHMVYNNINMTSALSQMFKKFSILAHAQDGKDYKNQQLDPLVDKSSINGQILNDVKYVWTRVTGINLTLYQGVKMIEKINFRDSYLALNCEKSSKKFVLSIVIILLALVIALQTWFKISLLVVSYIILRNKLPSILLLLLLLLLQQQQHL